MTKVVVISHEASLTGAPRIAFELSLHLQESGGYDVALVSQRPGPMQEFAKYRPIEQRLLDMGDPHVVPANAKLLIAQMQTTLLELRPDVVYVNTLPASRWLLAARRLGLATILHVHEMGKSVKKLVAAGLAAPDVLGAADGLVVASEPCATALEELFVPYRRPDVVLDVFIDPAEIDEASETREPDAKNRAGRPLDPAKRVVAMCGSACVRKGIDVFCEAARRMPATQFLWIGPWDLPDNPCLHEDVPDNLYMTGAVMNPYYYLRRADVFVLTSREDPQPIVVFEALALGKPVVCFSDAGDSKKLLGRYGYVLAGMPAASRLVSVLEKILAAGRDRPAWLLAGAREVREEYAVARRLEPVMELIASVAEKAAPQARGDVGRKAGVPG